MRKIILFIIPFLLTACHSPSLDLSMKVDVDEVIISNIDSIQLIAEGGCNETQKVSENETIYLFCVGTVEETFKLRLKLKNNIQIESNKIHLSYDDKVLITQENGKYKFETDKKSTGFELLKNVFIFLLVILFTKILTGLVVFNPDSKIGFIFKYGLFNLFLILLTFLIIGATASYEAAHSWGIIFVGFGFLGVLFIDFYYLYKYSKKKDKKRPLFIVIVGNTLLILIGTFIYNTFILGL